MRPRDADGADHQPHHPLLAGERMLHRSAVSRKITDSPAPIEVIPLSATAAANEPELSSIFQPVMSIACP